MSRGLAQRMLRRHWRGGELRLLAAALLLAITAVTGISLFVDRLERALVLEASAFLAADRRIEGREAPPEAWEAEAQALGLATARTVGFTSMAFSDLDALLVSVQAVSPSYPLRGALKTASDPLAAGAVTQDTPAPGTLWAAPRVLLSLGLEVGATLDLGAASLRIDRVLTDTPDQGGNFLLAPRVLMALSDVAKTQVLRPGARVEHALLLAGPESTLGAFEAQLPEGFDARFDLEDVRTGNRSLGRALDRAERFLRLGGLMAVLLASLAVALAAARYAAKQADAVAVMKTLGATSGTIRRLYLGQLFQLGALVTVLALGLAYGVQAALFKLLAAYVPVALPAPGWVPWVLGTLTGWLCLLAFALPPLLELETVTPVRVLRRDLAQASRKGPLYRGLGLLALLGLLFAYAGSFELAGWVLLGLGGTSAFFAALAFVLLRSGRVLGMQAGRAWRLGLAALSRRQGASIVQMLVFGTALMLLLTLTVLRSSLLDSWRAQLPEGAPNHFVLNLDSEERPAFQQALEAQGVVPQPAFPMTRGRITAVNGAVLDPKASRAAARLTEERNLSWSGPLPEGNEVVAGQWWDELAPVPGLSLEADFAAGVGLTLGDRVTLEVGDQRFDLPLVALRRVAWDSLRPNFFLLLSPGLLEDRDATYLTSFFLSPERQSTLPTLLRTFPSVSIIAVDGLIAQLQQIVARVSIAVEVVLFLVLGAGALVLLASIQSTMDERLREYGLLRALGGSRQRLQGALVVEFATLGAFSGMLAALGAELMIWAMETQLFGLPAQSHGILWFLGPVLGVSLVLTLGLLATRKVVSVPPLTVLREHGA